MCVRNFFWGIFSLRCSLCVSLKYKEIKIILLFATVCDEKEKEQGKIRGERAATFHSTRQSENQKGVVNLLHPDEAIYQSHDE